MFRIGCFREVIILLFFVVLFVSFHDLFESRNQTSKLKFIMTFRSVFDEKILAVVWNPGNLFFFSLHLPLAKMEFICCWKLPPTFLLWKVFEFYSCFDKKYVEALVFLQLLQNFLGRKKNSTNMFSSHCFFLQINCMHAHKHCDQLWVHSFGTSMACILPNTIRWSLLFPSFTYHLLSQENLDFCYWRDLSFLPYTF